MVIPAIPSCHRPAVHAVSVAPEIGVLGGLKTFHYFQHSVNDQTLGEQRACLSSDNRGLRESVTAEGSE
ncbi:hypothetical protein SERLA73DRAFT_187627 [Serpula lacrymans var. lacrymans S7.3]|uniref:Uncharacterized protein n=1 Tax=Serpula lacrymans var. lacrymans (strain S7.3) TaxID=936435 RepID=F8Q9S1_SERL3|nr:hypothetical protein SERLA73DRAFT_187627 [Serpula lacrymans var. lacrymans S7.3]